MGHFHVVFYMWERTAADNVPTWFSQHCPKFMRKNSFWTIWVISSDLNTDNSLQHFIFHQGEFYQVVAAQANVRKIVFFSEGCFSSATLLCIESTVLLSLVHCYECKVHMFWCFFQQSITILNFWEKLKNNYMLKCSTHVNPNTKAICLWSYFCMIVKTLPKYLIGNVSTPDYLCSQPIIWQ